MADTNDEIDDLVAAAETVLGLNIDESFRPGVATNLRNLRGLYMSVEGFDEGEAGEPLAIYRP